HSHWQNTSLQQSMFYNADLRDATFQRCNLAGANLAMISQNMDTRFEHCLTEKTHWIPRRYTVPA
ncbi:pentapeptide repeat-containing protein, partial [Yersinia pestis]